MEAPRRSSSPPDHTHFRHDQRVVFCPPVVLVHLIYLLVLDPLRPARHVEASAQKAGRSPARPGSCLSRAGAAWQHLAPALTHAGTRPECWFSQTPRPYPDGGYGRHPACELSLTMRSGWSKGMG
jgi:hypothetical protein